MNNISYGGFWRRSVAFSIDQMILQIVSLIVYYLGSKIMATDYGLIDFSSPLSFTLLWSYYGISLMLDMVYFTYFHGMTGQTPGKRLIGLRVIQKSGASMTLGIAFLRWVGYLISKIFLYLGFIWVAFNREKRGWHDFIAGTCVVRTAELTQSPNRRRTGETPFGPTFDSSSPLGPSGTNRSQWCMEDGRKANIEHISKILDKRKEIG
ncbi:MAG: RDD family protein [Deltaproteobacteria bacterium]|nr:RDD family protein [Deltaproteobacteria bacterium]